MEIPKELRWVGPLFGGLYLILWSMRGFAPFWAMVVFAAGIMIIVPAILIQVLFLLVFLGVVKRYRIATGIFFLSYFCSGVLMQQIQIYYLAFPPPPAMISPLTILMITPSMAAITIILFFQMSYLSTILWMLFLLVLAILTLIVTGLVIDSKIDAVLAMLLYVIIIIGWTFSIIPLTMYTGTHMIFTPIPLGPLVALNALPWFPLSRTGEQYIERKNRNRRFEEQIQRRHFVHFDLSLSRSQSTS